MANHMEPEQFFCPTFTSYTDDKSAETAARVATSSYLDEDDLNFEFDTKVLQSGNGNMFPNSFNHDDSLNGVALYSHMDSSDSSMSSDSDDQMYCLWRPKKTEASKQWKLLEFLKRSNSKRKGDFVILSPKKKKNLNPLNVSAVEEFYVRSRAVKEGKKRKSYLPYKKDLVGFFANVNVLGSVCF